LLETDVTPCLGKDRVPDYLITQLAEFLQQGSQLLQHKPDEDHPPTSSNPPRLDTKSAARSGRVDSKTMVGSTAPVGEVSMEGFYHWCLDQLFLIYSDMLKGRFYASRRYQLRDLYHIPNFLDDESSHRSVAALCLLSSADVARCLPFISRMEINLPLPGHTLFPAVTLNNCAELGTRNRYICCTNCGCFDCGQGCFGQPSQNLRQDMPRNRLVRDPFSSAVVG